MLKRNNQDRNEGSSFRFPDSREGFVRGPIFSWLKLWSNSRAVWRTKGTMHLLNVPLPSAVGVGFPHLSSLEKSTGRDTLYIRSTTSCCIPRAGLTLAIGLVARHSLKLCHP